MYDEQKNNDEKQNGMGDIEGVCAHFYNKIWRWCIKAKDASSLCNYRFVKIPSTLNDNIIRYSLFVQEK